MNKLATRMKGRCYHVIALNRGKPQHNETIQGTFCTLLKAHETSSYYTARGLVSFCRKDTMQ